MSIFCENCCGDGLDHYSGDVFELVQDDPCGNCGGLGVNEDAGDPIKDAKKYLRRHSMITVNIYVGEGKDEFEEFEVAYSGAHYEGSRGGRDSSGFQYEPDEPAGWELDDFHIEINGEWYSFDPDEETATSNNKAPHRCLSVYDRVIELLEDD